MIKQMIILAPLLLAGCASKVVTLPSVQAPTISAPAPVQSNPLAQLATFTLGDLQAASADAKAQSPADVTASQCYDFLIVLLPTLPSFSPGAQLGAVLAFQKLRDLQNGVSGAQGALKSLNLACAPLVIDTQTVINKLLLVGVGTAVTSSSLAPLGAMLPGLVP